MKLKKEQSHVGVGEAGFSKPFATSRFKPGYTSWKGITRGCGTKGEKKRKNPGCHLVESQRQGGFT